MDKKLKFSPTALTGVYLITPSLFEDDRGMFFRTYCRAEFSEIGLTKDFLQMNHSINYLKGTLRGLHFQTPNAPEDKLVRCIKGSIHDVVVDLRQNSETLMKYVSFKLTEQNRSMVYVPAGCAHGFITLADNSEVLYCHTGIYNSSEESGVRFDDPLIHIEWPEEIKHISKRDATHVYLSTQFSGYSYEM